MAIKVKPKTKPKQPSNEPTKKDLADAVVLTKNLFAKKAEGSAIFVRKSKSGMEVMMFNNKITHQDGHLIINALLEELHPELKAAKVVGEFLDGLLGKQIKSDK